MLFDSHAHLNDANMSEDELKNVAAAIEKSSLDYVIDVGFDFESSSRAVKHAVMYPWCYAVVGCHPHDSEKLTEKEFTGIREMAHMSKVVAIGETGLDFHYENSPKDVQREWFRRHIRLANELKMPLVIHSREADREVMDILIEEGAFSDERKSWFSTRTDSTGFVSGKKDCTGSPDGFCDDARVLLHCFSGSAELGREYVKLGATLSVAGPVTFKNNKKTVKMVEEIPIDFLLVETDSPYLTPEPYRGRKNIPPFVEHTAIKLAEIKGVSYEYAAIKTMENAMNFYGIM